MDNETNPYAAPVTDLDDGRVGKLTFDERDKIEAIAKDANQFWAAILLCMFCAAIGAMIIAPWYLVRLLQWRSLAASHPELLVPNPPGNSLEYRFQKAKLKLILGLIGGVGIFSLLVLLFATGVISP